MTKDVVEQNDLPVETMYYYAYYERYNDEFDIITWIGALPTPIAGDGYFEITEDQYLNGKLIGKAYKELQDALDEMAVSIDNKADAKTVAAMNAELQALKEQVDKLVNQ